jgi:3-oxoacyl-[acyl-carrier-protein] synthase-3
MFHCPTKRWLYLIGGEHYLADMRFQNVCLEAVGYTLPDEVISSEQIEERLAPVYQRLRLPEGRLELMTGIRERRFFPKGTLPSTMSAQSAQRALQSAGIAPYQIGCLIHGSVCRDFLEPATACRVHHLLGLSADCLIYDVSNACLGLLNGMLQIANMIELGQIRAGLVVGTESSRSLVETTIDHLNANESLTREQMKRAVASLTIGSGSAAVVLAHRSISRTGNRLVAAASRASTGFHRLCHSDRDDSVGGGMHPLMDTDSEQLMHAGIQVGAEAFGRFIAELGWSPEEIDKTFTHQVGVAHRKLMLEKLGLLPNADFPTVEWLGNTGSVALPLTMALGIEAGHLQAGDRLAMLGIGSGINVLMIAAEWQTAGMGATGGDEMVPAKVAVGVAR